MEAMNQPISLGKVHRRRSRLAEFREGIRRWRLDRAARARSLRSGALRAPSLPGSEHTHLLPPKKY